MDFAKKLLNKYGWSDGQGLGRNNDGIVKPLKANYKFDKSGFGENQAESDFNNHWWQRVYNDAAQNVEVKPNKNGHVTAKLKADAESVEISTLSYSAKKLKKAKQKNDSKDEKLYGNFMQVATLTNTGALIENEHKVENIDVAKYKILSDAELFEACGGRTAHKGARHGLNLNGKLNRVQQQEKELFEKMQDKLKTKKSNETIKKDIKDDALNIKKQQSEVASERVLITQKMKKKRKVEQSDKCILNSNANKDEFEETVIQKKQKKNSNIEISMEIAIKAKTKKKKQEK